MLDSIKWNGVVKINGIEYQSIEQAVLALKGYSGNVSIVLQNEKKPREINISHTPKVLRIKVRQYMTKPSCPEFNFHDRYNEGIPMPMRVMVGTILQETKGMVKMELRGEPQEGQVRCLRCGRQLIHPVSKLYGIGPECGQHFHIPPQGMSIEECKKLIRDISWTGWIIKSAIEESEEIKK